MMRLDDIHRLIATVDEAGRSPVADVVAAAWGHAPGAARHWRSSASHVFVLPRAYLRMVPPTARPRDEFVAVVELMRALGERGVAVTPSVPSCAGALVETVATPLGDMHAMVVEAAPGERIDVDALTVARATAWGQALARLHEAGRDVGVRLPGPLSELDHVAQVFPDDPALVAAATDIARRLATLPRDPARFGIVHGDFELDNLSWDGDTVVAYDFDEAARSWFVADIVNAVRDLAGRTELYGAFLTGYRRERPLPEPDLAHVPLLAAAQAACAAVRVRRALVGDTDVLVGLRGRLHEYLGRQRAMVVAAL
jgi:Ser/Thr protein kinase RdoA (MazF antagonist)